MQTHSLTFTKDLVRKRFMSTHAGEADREWGGLTFLDRHAPGLAPRPVAREVEAGASVVVMSRVPGAPLGRSPLSPAQIVQLAGAVRRLFSVPVPEGLPERINGPSTMRALICEWAAGHYDLVPCRDRVLVRDALRAAREWLVLETAPEVVTDAVLALGDGNLANVMWDGHTCRLIDFEEFGVSDISYVSTPTASCSRASG